MKVGYWILGGLGLVLIAMAIFLIFFANGWYYLRALQLVYTAPHETRAEMKVKLFASEKPNTHGGIVAGVMGERVWVWGQRGLTSFDTDNDSVYFYKDICSEETRAALEEGIAGGIVPSIDTGLDKWQAKLRAGDYMVVTIAVKENGGVEGNLREAHAYNYWPFVAGDINTVCAK